MIEEKILQDTLGGVERLAILGIGSDMRGDDAAGILAAETLDKLLKDKIKEGRARVFYGLSAPENLTGEIRRFGPTHILIIDAADMGEEPGAVSLIDEARISGASLSTHQMPLNMLALYLRTSLNCPLSIIGIQPKLLGLSDAPSQEVKEAAARLAGAISRALEAG